MSNDYETLRWPTNLDREAIIVRLVEIRELARSSGHTELAELFFDVEAMPSARIGSRVIAALTSIEGKPEHIGIGTQLSMVAMNLKNLK